MEFTMKAWQIILIIICLISSFVLGYRINSIIAKDESILTDTVIVVDTVRDSVPIPIKEVITKYVQLSDTIVHNDTIYIPIIQKEYTTDNYHAWVSGYKPSLDSIIVFPKTMYITKKVPDRRFGLGIIGGYGIGQNGLSPYIGIGVYYRIW